FAAAGHEFITGGGYIQKSGRSDRPSPVYRSSHVLALQPARVHAANRRVCPILAVFEEIVPAPAGKETVPGGVVVIDAILIGAIFPKPRCRHGQIVIPGLLFR